MKKETSTEQKVKELHGYIECLEAEIQERQDLIAGARFELLLSQGTDVEVAKGLILSMTGVQIK